MVAVFPPSIDTASSAIIHRPFGGVAGYRQLVDRAGCVTIHAFPLSMLQQLAAAGLFSSAGAYIVTDDRIAYIGESMRPGRRLSEHASDIAKRSFARDAFIVTGREGCPFGKAVILDLQYRFTTLALGAGVVSVMKGTGPTEIDLPGADRATQDRIFSDALRLLYDAGCRIFQSPGEPGGPKDPPVDDVADLADSGPMDIGVTTTPLGAEEFELRYDDVWARGYWAGGHFIVTAGSEVRSATNGSVNQITRTRREDLFKAGVLATIPDVDDRRRLITAVAFSSQSIAAKVVCGAHTAGKWTPLTPCKAVVMTP